MSGMQEENNEETSEEESRDYLGPQTQTLEEVSKTGWEVKLVSQTEDTVTFKVYCKDQSRTWYELIARAPKRNFRRV